jgi:hypothetical protein
MARPDESEPIELIVRTARPDLDLIDALARLQLVAGRVGASIEVRTVSTELRELIELCGLAEALGLEVGRQSEGGEELGIQEVVQPGDPIS